MVAMRSFSYLACLAPLLALITMPALADDVKASGTPAAAVAGRVAGPDGKPVAGATVRVRAAEDWSSMLSAGWKGPAAPIVVTTAEDGSFRVDGVDGPKLMVRIEAEGLAPYYVDDVPRGGTLDVKLKRGVPLEGRVFDRASREPVPGAIVVALDRGSERFGSEGGFHTVAGDDGRFTIADLPPGPIVIEAWSRQHALSRRRDVSVEAHAPDGGETRPPALEFFLPPGGRLSGRVVGANSQPLPDSRVWVRRTSHDRGSMDVMSPPRGVTTDAAGRFAIEGIAVGRVQVVAAKSGFGEAPSDEIEVERGTDRIDIELTLAESASLAFRLVDVDGKPVKGASVTLTPDAHAELGNVRTPAPSGTVTLSGDQIDVDEDGRMIAGRIDAGTFDVVILPDDGIDIERNEVRLRAGEVTDLGTLRVVEGSFVSGRVTDRAGNPVAGAVVTATWRKEREWRHRTTKTRSDGRYKIGGLVAEQRTSLRVLAKGFRREDRRNATPGNDAVDFTLERTGSVAGKVVLADGSVPASFRIRIHPEAGTRNAAAMSLANQDRWWSDPNGRFRIDDLPPGQVTVEAGADGKAPSRKSGVQVVAEGLVEVGTLVLEDGRTLRGRVLGAADEVAVAGAAVAIHPATASSHRLYGSDAVGAETISGSDGSFSFRGLEGRVYTLVAAHPDYAVEESAVEVPGGQDPSDVVVHLSRGGTLTGTVRDASGQPVAGATVQAGRSISDSDVAEATTGPDGIYVMARLATGSYTVLRTPDGRSFEGLATKQAVIVDGETTVVDFGENARHNVTGRVLKGDRAVPGAAVVFSPGEAGFGAAGMRVTDADAEGRYRVALDAPGPYTVYLQWSDDSPTGRSLKVIVPDAPTASLDLVIRAAGVLGRVIDPDGRPVGSASVNLRRDHDIDLIPVGEAESGPDGAFTIDGVEPGPYLISAATRGYARSASHRVVVDDQQPTPYVELRLGRARVIRGRVVDSRGIGVQGASVTNGRSGSFDAAPDFSTTDVNGAFALTLGEETAYDIAAFAPGYALGLTRGVTPDQSEVTVQLGTGGTARIEVVRTDGAPVAGARVLLRANPPYLGSDLVSFFARPQATDANGQTSVPALRPGTYDVLVELGPRSTTAQLGVTEGGEAFVRVTLP